MTRQELIAYIADQMWMNGIGNKKGGALFAERLVDYLIAKGIVTVKENT